MKRIKNILLLLLMGFILYSCEDPAPMEYKMEYYVECYLIAGQPVSTVRIMNTQPLYLPFSMSNGHIENADVKITCYKSTDANAVDTVLTLKFHRDNLPPEKIGYYVGDMDTSFKIKPNILYKLRVLMNDKDNTVITGETFSPDEIDWRRFPRDTIDYPKDTINLPVDTNYAIAWKWKDPIKTTFMLPFILSTKCMDTSEYGKFLVPPTTEKNRTTYSILTSRQNSNDPNSNYYKDKTYWALLQSMKTQTVWLAFKWFGLYEISVYAPDYNFMRWFLNDKYSRSQNPLSNSVKSEQGIHTTGVFGSATVVKHYVFMRKNQP